MNMSKLARTVIALAAIANIMPNMVQAGKTESAFEYYAMPIYFEKGNIDDAYRTAIALNLPLVVIFTHRQADGTYGDGDQLFAEMRSNQFGIDNRQAVFYICCVRDERGGPVDEAGIEFLKKMDIKKFPSTVILAVSAEQVELAVVIQGKFSAEELTTHYHKYLRIANTKMAEWQREKETMMSEAKQADEQPGQATAEG